MKVSFNNNYAYIKNNFKSNDTNSKTSAPTENNERDVLCTGICGITPQQIGKAAGGLLALAGVIKFRKKIGAFIKKLIEPAVDETVKEVKPRVKKLYNNITEDYYIKKQEYIKKRYVEFINGPDPYFPNGVVYISESKPARDRAVADLIKHLEDHGWNIQKVPEFDVSKADDYSYCRSYILENITLPIARAKEEFKKTGKITAFVIRDMDVLWKKNSAASNLLPTTEYINQSGCSLIADITKFEPKYDGYMRSGRFDILYTLRSLPEDTQEIWEAQLKRHIENYNIDFERMKSGKEPKSGGIDHWRLQDTIDKFPEQYRESSELYQKLKDTKYYPFEF